LSRAIVTSADVSNNDYKVRVPGFSVVFSAQCVTQDELRVGDEVVIADIDNLPPEKAKTKGKIRVLPPRGNYSYSIDSRWYKAQDIKALGKKASLMYSYIWSSDQNPKWQRERPSYRKGVLKKIHDAKYVDVEITLPWRATKETKRCRVDYMTCDTTAFGVDDEVLVKFENSDARKPFIVGKWDDPGLCDAYLYCAIKIDDRITENEIGGGISESSISSESSSSSQDSKSSESASSDSEGIKGLDDYYAFIWDPKINDFPVILDSITGEQIQFPCRAERLEQWLLESTDVSQIEMDNRRAGRLSTIHASGWGESKRKFYDGNWDDMIVCLDEDNQPDACTPSDDCDEAECGDAGEEYWLDFYNNTWARCGLYESGVITDSNPLTGVNDAKNFSVERSCYDDGGSPHEDRLVIAGSSVNAVLIRQTGSNHDFFSSRIHGLDGWEVNTITSEDCDYYHKEDIVGSSYSSLIYMDVEYSTDTFLGDLYSNVAIREYDKTGAGSPDYIARAMLAQSFSIGRRCATGTFVWLGLQGVETEIRNWSDPIVEDWVIKDKHNYALAYCDTGGFGSNPFDGKSDNTTISDVIKQMIDKFYEEDPGGAVLDFGVDVRWVSGPAGSYSSISSSSISSSSLSSSSISSSESSESSLSESSNSSESIP
jgi:hypothetical protein